MINQNLANNYKSKIQNLLSSLDTKKINKFCKIIKDTQEKKYIYFWKWWSSPANHFANDMTKNAKIKTLSYK